MAITYTRKPPEKVEAEFKKAKPTDLKPVDLWKRYKRLAELGETRVAELNTLMVDGFTTFQIAKVIQEDWHAMGDLKRTSVVQLITRYRLEVMGKRTMAKVDRPPPKVVASQLKEFVVDRKKGLVAVSFDHLVGKVRVMEGLESLARAQMARVNKLLAQEEKMPVVMDATRREMILLKDILSTCGNLQLELGILRRVPKRVEGFVSVSNQAVTLEGKRVSEDLVLGDQEADATNAALEILAGLVAYEPTSEGLNVKMGEDDDS